MKRLQVFGVVCAVLFLLSNIFVSLCLAQDKVITLRFSNQFAPTSGNSIVLEEWCKEVEKRTNGKVVVKYYPGNALNPPQQAYDSVVGGVVDLSNHILGYTAGKFPLTEVLDYPLGYTKWLYCDKIDERVLQKI